MGPVTIETQHQQQRDDDDATTDTKPTTDDSSCETHQCQSPRVDATMSGAHYSRRLGADSARTTNPDTARRLSVSYLLGISLCGCDQSLMKTGIHLRKHCREFPGKVRDRLVSLSGKGDGLPTERLSQRLQAVDKRRSQDRPDE